MRTDRHPALYPTLECWDLHCELFQKHSTRELIRYIPYFKISGVCEGTCEWEGGNLLCSCAGFVICETRAVKGTPRLGVPECCTVLYIWRMSPTRHRVHALLVEYSSKTLSYSTTGVTYHEHSYSNYKKASLLINIIERNHTHSMQLVINTINTHYRLRRRRHHPRSSPPHQMNHRSFRLHHRHLYNGHLL